jgi:hypothetical protein
MDRTSPRSSLDTSIVYGQYRAETTPENSIGQLNVLTSPALVFACVNRVESMVTDLVNSVHQTESSIPPIPAPRKAFCPESKVDMKQLEQPVPAPRNIAAAMSQHSTAPPNTTTLIATSENSESTTIVSGNRSILTGPFGAKIKTSLFSFRQ